MIRFGKVLFLILMEITLTVPLSRGQTFTDIAATQGVTFIQSTPDNTANGMSFYDFDEDGWDDLTFPASDSILFYRNVNGVFQKIPSYIPSEGYVREVVWVDYDNDFDLDIAVSYDSAGFRLYQNNGAFVFSDVTVIAGISNAPFEAFGFSFADPDNDSDLDLYVCSHELTGVHPNPQVNLYYENNGNGTFTEKAQLLGIDNGDQPTFMPVWFDYNDDNLLDLGLINDKMNWNDALYVNLGGGQWADSAAVLGFSNNGHNPMSLSISDFDNDGDEDVFKTDVGNDSPTFGVPLDHKLYRNESGTGFTEIAQGTGLDTNLFSWGALWVDYNNDCFEDLYIATTFGSGFESLLFRNNSGSSFDLMNSSIVGNITQTSFCPVKGDINNDGFYDILVLNDNANPNVLLNSGNGNNYIKIDLEGIFSNQKGIGSKIEVYANNQHQTQRVFCGSGLCAQNSQHKIFGTGPATIVDSVVVTFPSGIIAKKYALPTNASYTISEQAVINLNIAAGADTVRACPGQTFNIGVPGLHNYQWNTGSTDSIVAVQGSGTYSFEATNLVGDTLYISNSVHYEFESPLNVITTSTPSPCGVANGGAAQVILNPQSIVMNTFWSNGVAGNVNNNLSPGSYSYSILTENFCSYSGSVIVESEPVFTSQFTTSPVTDTALGSVNIFTWGGQSPFTFLLDGDTLSNSIGGLNEGQYTVTIIDALGCTDSLSFTIPNNSTATLSEIENEPTIVYYNEGEVSVCTHRLNTLNSIEITTAGGSLVASIDDVKSEQNCIQIPFEFNESGMYLVNLRFTNSSEVHRVYVGP